VLSKRLVKFADTVVFALPETVLGVAAIVLVRLVEEVPYSNVTVVLSPLALTVPLKVTEVRPIFVAAVVTVVGHALVLKLTPDPNIPCGHNVLTAFTR
jgi:hypothetical protein